MNSGKTRQNPTKRRSLRSVNEHFEEDSNAVLSSAIVLQQPVTVEMGFQLFRADTKPVPNDQHATGIAASPARNAVSG